jgi:A/G-specific adenine glycosylase
MIEPALPPIAKNLLAWYRTRRRPLPWRESTDPYKIWVSEIMLQQTQVKTVIPYYRRWLKEFPGVRALAGARRERVLKLWEGLGYYSRAKNLHEGAKLLCRRYGGKMPSDPGEIRKVPGIGRYTAGAILSIAFGKPEPVLDGNVSRVLSRLTRLASPVDGEPGRKILWALAEKCLSEKEARRNPGDFNQALMELGATICVPADPACGLCPVRASCLARRHGDPRGYPRKTAKTAVKKVRAVCGIVRSNGKILISRRPSRGLWAGLWEFPTYRLTGGEPPESVLEKSLRRAGITARVTAKRGRLRRAYTNHCENLDIYQCEGRENSRRNKTAGREDLRWVPVPSLSRYAFPAAFVKIMRTYL